MRASESAEYPAIREFRHGFTHRLVSRHVKVLLGQPTRSEFESEVGNFRQTAIAGGPRGNRPHLVDRSPDRALVRLQPLPHVEAVELAGASQPSSYL